MTDTLAFKKTEKQKQAIKLMANYTEILLEGGSRSGKSFIICYAILVRAIRYPGSKHLMLRFHFAHIKSIIFQTMPDVFKICFPELTYKLNKQDWFFELPNGSQIWAGGTDDKERIEKLLGWEWATLFLNEASQLPFITYDMVKSRLNPPKDVKPLILIDYNPPSMSHWGYVIFHKGLNYDTKEPLTDPDRYAKLQMNPTDNLANLSSSYMGTLNSMGERRRNRFLYGNYSDDTEGAIFKRDWIINNRRQAHPDLTRVVVAVDPATTGKSSSDDTGIIVVGKGYMGSIEHFFVLADLTFHGSVTGWGQIVAEAYRKYQADRVIGEVNNGGDLVEVNIKNYDRNLAYKSVHASRGKAVRAEPVAELYERGLVHHVGIFYELEEQQTSWTPESTDSPNNMDALVWGLTELSTGAGGDWGFGYAT